MSEDIRQSRCEFYEPGSGCLAGHFDGDPTDEDCAECDFYSGPSRGLGDRIAKVTRVTGIGRVVDAASRVTGRDCGCSKRRKKLNEQFPAKD